jgi:hypothetical protein
MAIVMVMVVVIIVIWSWSFSAVCFVYNMGKRRNMVEFVYKLVDR